MAELERPFSEKLIYRSPQLIGTFGLIPVIVLGHIAKNDEKLQHIVSLTTLLLGAMLAIVYFIADLYPYTRLLNYDKVITCGAHVSISYMIAAAIMYSWLHSTGNYYYYLLWLNMHSCILLFPSFIIFFVP